MTIREAFAGMTKSEGFAGMTKNKIFVEMTADRPPNQNRTEYIASNSTCPADAPSRVPYVGIMSRYGDDA